MGDEAERSPGGSEIRRHEEARPPEPVPTGWSGMELVEAHVERHIGPIATVFHELASEFVHLDVLIVEATDERPVHHLVTSGMSSRPMDEGGPEDRLSELYVVLPREWPLDEDSWRDHSHYWPVSALKLLARAPHEYGFLLRRGDTVPNSDPPEPYADGTALCGALVCPGVTVPREFDTLDTPDGTINFNALWLLHADEMEFKLERGYAELIDAFERAQVTEEIDVRRRSAVRRKRFGLF